MSKLVQLTYLSGAPCLVNLDNVAVVDESYVSGQAIGSDISFSSIWSVTVREKLKDILALQATP